jgi:hypothetical protein
LTAFRKTAFSHRTVFVSIPKLKAWERAYITYYKKKVGRARLKFMAPDKKGQKEREKCQNIWSMKRERSRGDFFVRARKQIGDAIVTCAWWSHGVCVLFVTLLKKLFIQLRCNET